MRDRNWCISPQNKHWIIAVALNSQLVVQVGHLSLKVDS